MPAHRIRIAALAAVFASALLAGGLAAAPAGASHAADLFFSEYVEGTSNNKALEIYNGTGSPIDLAAGGYNVQMFFNGSASPGLTINLVGTVPDGGVFVLSHASASPAILAVAQQTSGAGWFNGDDAVVLRKGGQTLDVIGQIGLDPGSQWGSGLSSTADNTLWRKPTVTAGDPDGADPFDPSIEWEGFNTNTFDGLGMPPCTDETAPSLSVAISPETLWPPNHKYVAVEATVAVSDAGDPNTAATLLSVDSDEPDNALGDADGNTTGDVVVVDDDSFRLRAERDETAAGRTYTATYGATDACGNFAVESATVSVPITRK